VEHKDFCNKKFQELEMTTMKKTEEQSGLNAKIDDTKNQLDADKEKITQINAEITEATVAIQSANVDRVKESQDFQTVVADQRAVQQVLLTALDKLEKFYGKDAFVQKPKSFVQTAPAATTVESKAAAPAAKTASAAKETAPAAKAAPAAKSASVATEQESNATKSFVQTAPATNATQHVLTTHAARPSEAKMAVNWHKSWGVKVADHAKAAEGLNPTVVRKRGMDKDGKIPSFQNLPKSRIVQDLMVKKALMQGSQTPPGQFSTYKKHAGSGAVLAMLKSLIKEAQRIEADAISEENTAVQSYSRFIDDSQSSREALFVELLSAQERTAEAEVQIAEDQKSVDLLTDDLADLSSETAATHEACDFVLKNFDIRQKARSQEIEALGQAKAILSGAK
jgi:hypothetical protein